jgi:hypothetical protein
MVKMSEKRCSAMQSVHEMCCGITGLGAPTPPSKILDPPSPKSPDERQDIFLPGVKVCRSCPNPLQHKRFQAPLTHQTRCKSTVFGGRLVRSGLSLVL